MQSFFLRLFSPCASLCDHCLSWKSWSPPPAVFGSGSRVLNSMKTPIWFCGGGEGVRARRGKKYVVKRTSLGSSMLVGISSRLAKDDGKMRATPNTEPHVSQRRVARGLLRCFSAMCYSEIVMPFTSGIPTACFIAVCVKRVTEIFIIAYLEKSSHCFSCIFLSLSHQLLLRVRDNREHPP